MIVHTSFSNLYNLHFQPGNEGTITEHASWIQLFIDAIRSTLKVRITIEVAWASLSSGALTTYPLDYSVSTITMRSQAFSPKLLGDLADINQYYAPYIAAWSLMSDAGKLMIVIEVIDGAGANCAW
ncbi:hypothetical protein [Undibacterium sp. TJN19]|uniref:hypothetical protein n=1 Tax=Undibacterium sp. TJN19 TaxID=3413055 RepID=UPI003BEFB364